MINQIKRYYSICEVNSCNTISNVSFYLKDPDAGKCIISNNSKDGTCFIENPSSKDINFVAIDECLIPATLENKGIKKCDALVFDDIIMWFIEIKEVQFSGNSKLDAQKRRNGRKKAVEQIASTINDFKNKGVDLSTHKIAGLISFPPYINQTNPITIPTVASQALILKFANECGFADLYEGNHLLF